MWKMLTLLYILAGGLVGIQGQNSYYMDQPSACGEHVRVGASAIYVHGRSKVATGNAPVSCVIYLQTDSSDSKYKLEMTVQSLTINDCTIKLEIFDHDQAFGQHLRSVGCGSKSTDTLYSSGRYMTLKLTRSRDLYRPDYDYTLSIRAYSDEDENGGLSRVNKIGVEVIVPVIVCVLLLVIVAVILCLCYRQGKFPGMQGRKPRKYISGSSTSLSNNYSEKKPNGGVDNPVVSVTPGESRKVVGERNGFNPQSPIVWSTLTSADSSKDPITGRQRGRSALMSQSSSVPPPPSLPGENRHGQTGNHGNSANGYSPQNSSRMYRKNDRSRSSNGGPEEPEKKVDSYLESKGVKIDIYPDDSMMRLANSGNGGRSRGSYAEAQGKGRDSYAEEGTRKRGSYAEAQGRKRGSYADDDRQKHAFNVDAQGRNRASYADDDRKKRGSYAERDKEHGGHLSRRDANPSEAENGRGTGRKGTSPSRKGSSPNRQGSSSPGRRRSPGEKRRSRSEDTRENSNADAPPEGKLKRPSSGFFDNPDEEGYIYSYDHLYPGEDGDISGSTQTGESPKAGHRKGRRGSAAVEFEEDEDGYLLVHNDSKGKPYGKGMSVPKQKKSKSDNGRQPQSDGTSYETIEMNPGQNAQPSSQTRSDPKTKNGIKENDQSKSLKEKVNIPELQDTYGANEGYSSVDDLSEPTEHETISNPLHANPAVKSRLEGSKPLGDAESGPAKKRKGNERHIMDDNMSEAGSVRYGIPRSAMTGNQNPRERVDSYPYTVGPGAIAPRTSESMGPHGQSFMSAFENRAPITHNSPAHVAGKAAWYVQTTPSRTGPVTHGTFVMQTTSRQPSQEGLESSPKHARYGQTPGSRFPDHIPSDSDSSHRPLHPAASTPNSYNPRSTFNTHQHFSPIEKAERTPGGYGHNQYPERRGQDGYPDYRMQNQHDPNAYPGNTTDPRTALVRNHPSNSQTPPRYAPPGTSIFDEPGHRAAVMRSGIDPNTGNEVNQVVWTDTIPDPTDPSGPNPSISRKTITRITTRAGHGDIPDPDSMTSQLSFETYADRLSAPANNDPAFLSPSTSHQRYGGNPRVPEPSHGQEYPGDDNVAFYLGLKGQSNPTARVHQAQARNHAIRDKISLPEESFA